MESVLTVSAALEELAIRQRIAQRQELEQLIRRTEVKMIQVSRELVQLRAQYDALPS